MRRFVPLLLVALFLAACGGSSRLSKTAYEQHLKLAGTHATKASNSVGNARVSHAAFAKRLVGAKQEMQAAVDELDSITPPKDAEADNDRIVSTLRFLATEIGKLQRAAAKNDKAAAASVSADIQRSKEITAGANAAKDLERKGYDVGVFGQ